MMSDDRQKRTLQGLLNFCVEHTAAEDVTGGDGSQDMTAEVGGDYFYTCSSCRL